MLDSVAAYTKVVKRILSFFNEYIDQMRQMTGKNVNRRGVVVNRYTINVISDLTSKIENITRECIKEKNENSTHTKRKTTKNAWRCRRCKRKGRTRNIPRLRTPSTTYPITLAHDRASFLRPSLIFTRYQQAESSLHRVSAAAAARSSIPSVARRP